MDIHQFGEWLPAHRIQPIHSDQRTGCSGHPDRASGRTGTTFTAAIIVSLRFAGFGITSELRRNWPRAAPASTGSRSWCCSSPAAC